MTGPTHLALGVSAVWLIAPIPGALGHGQAGGPANPALLTLAAALGALLPDLDTQRSTIRYLRVDLGRRISLRPFGAVASLVSRTVGHRGPLHSLLGALILWLPLGLPALLWAGWQPSAALAVGLLSHLAGDGCTRSGVPLLFPGKGAGTCCRPACVSRPARKPSAASSGCWRSRPSCCPCPRSCRTPDGFSNRSRRSSFIRAHRSSVKFKP